MLKARKIRFWKYRIKKYADQVQLPKFKIIFSKSVRREFLRKSVHLSSLWIPALIYFASVKISFSVFLFLFVGDLLLEYGNHKKWRWTRATYGKIFSGMLRPKERKNKNFVVCGSAYVSLAAMICVLVFSKEVAIVALTIMLISDTFAAVVGKIYGSRRLRENKSVEGTFAFFISSLLVVLACNPLFTVSYASIIACFAATFVEMFEDKIRVDDNLSIPLVVGVILTFI